jgi:hypothetical protein
MALMNVVPMMALYCYIRHVCDVRDGREEFEERN